ncbi:MAG: LemA family protein [bacterium]|nr:LemA family protein [bacterium]
MFLVTPLHPWFKSIRPIWNFRPVQPSLTSTENMISFARQFYNDEVMKYNANGS